MQRSIFYFAHFALILLLFSGTNGSVPMDDMKKAYCRDQPKVDILSSQDLADKTSVYFAHSGSNYVVTRKGGLGKPAEDVEINLGEALPDTSSNRYFFVGNLSGYALKVGQKWPFMGYNQDWIGCPQSLCMDGHLDAAADDTDNSVYFFSGAFFWKSNNSKPAMTLTEAVEIEGKKYLDAAFCDNGRCYLVKDGQVFLVDDKNKMSTDTESLPTLRNMCADKTTRAVAATSKSFVVFLETKHCRRSIFSDLQKAKDHQLPEQFQDIDAAFVRGGQLHLVKQWTYFKAPVNTIDDDTPLTEVGEASSVFDELFGCQNFDYQSSSSITKEEYRQKMDRLVKGITKDEWEGNKLVADPTPEPSSEAENPQKGDTSSSSMGIIIAIVAVVVVLLVGAAVLMVFLVWRKKSKKGQRSKARKAKLVSAMSKISSSQIDSQIDSGGGSQSRLDSSTGSKFASKLTHIPPPKPDLRTEEEKKREHKFKRMMDPILLRKIEHEMLYEGHYVPGSIQYGTYKLEERDLPHISKALRRLMGAKRLYVWDRIKFTRGVPEHIRPGAFDNPYMTETKSYEMSTDR